MASTGSGKGVLQEGLGRLKALPVFLMSSGEMWKLSLAGPLSPLAPNPHSLCLLLETFASPLFPSVHQ